MDNSNLSQLGVMGSQELLSEIQTGVTQEVTLKAHNCLLDLLPMARGGRDSHVLDFFFYQ